MKIFNKVWIIILAVVFIFGLIGPTTASAATTPSLGVAGTFGVLGGTFTNTNPTTINGDVGYTTPPVSMPTINGSTYIGGGVGNATYVQAKTDASDALTALNLEPCTENLGVIVNLSTVGTHPTGVYTPGVYCSTGAMSIGTAGITLSGAGTYIFRAVGALTSAAGSVVRLAEGASSCNVFWTPTAATTLSANTTFIGTIIDNNNAISVGANTVWTGRALSLFDGIITTDKNTITTACSVPVTPTPTPVPTPTPITTPTPVLTPTPTPTPTPVVTSTPTPVPSFPNAGIAPDENNNALNIIISAGVLVGLFSFYLLARRKQLI